MYQKIGILAVLASVLLSAALLATPTFKVANAQENQTQGNQTQGTQTQGLDVDKWIVVLKKSNPTLNDVQQVSGAASAYDMVISLDVPVSQSVQLSNLFSQVITGQVYDFNTFQQALQNALAAGLDFNAVDITSIAFEL